MRSFSKTTLVLAFGFTAAGCTNLNYPQSTVDSYAVKQNFAAQVVDPTPAEGAPKADAGKVDGAAERYRNDEVKQAGAEASQDAVTLSFSPDGGGGD